MSRWEPVGIEIVGVGRWHLLCGEILLQAAGVDLAGSVVATSISCTRLEPLVAISIYRSSGPKLMLRIHESRLATYDFGPDPTANTYQGADRTRHADN